MTGAPNGVPSVEPRGGVHAPVLRNAAIDSLAIRADGCYVDATFGRGGHAGEILGRLGDEGKLIAIDRDPEAAAAAAVLFDADPRARFVRARFSELGQHVAPRSADGILFDLGVSSPQLDEARRGFSFLRDGPLDMRMDPDAGATAAEFLARSDEREIAVVIARLGEERHARRIARAIVCARESSPDRDDRPPRRHRCRGGAGPRAGPSPCDSHFPGTAHPRERRAWRDRARAAAGGRLPLRPAAGSS